MYAVSVTGRREGGAQEQYETVYSQHFNMLLYQFTDVMSTQYAFEDHS